MAAERRPQVPGPVDGRGDATPSKLEGTRRELTQGSLAPVSPREAGLEDGNPLGFGEAGAEVPENGEPTQGF